MNEHVWLLLIDAYDGGDTPQGVYATKEAAQKAAEAYARDLGKGAAYAHLPNPALTWRTYEESGTAAAEQLGVGYTVNQWEVQQ